MNEPKKGNAGTSNRRILINAKIPICSQRTNCRMVGAACDIEFVSHPRYFYKDAVVQFKMVNTNSPIFYIWELGDTQNTPILFNSTPVMEKIDKGHRD